MPITEPPPRSYKSIRRILFLLALITSPLCCCGIATILDGLPPELLPDGLGFILNVFEVEASVENRTADTFYLTAITTTTGRPVVIRQPAFGKQRDIPLGPGQTVTPTYDADDAPLSGIAVCKTDEDCRVLTVNYSGEYHIDDFNALPVLEPSWSAAIKATPEFNLAGVGWLAVSLVPVGLLAALGFLGRPRPDQAR